ncbi:MAG TPA: CHAD domain-containing protein [Steroidobacteraceae bacterium]|jgi:CHAD domain-containing protein
MSSAAHKDCREIEWQLASTDLAAVRRWLDQQETIEGLVVAPQSTLQIFDTYFDTQDWRIFRAGYALRVRSEAGKAEATLKSLHTNTGAKADRRELNELIDSGAGDWNGQSDGPVGSRVQAVSGSLPLQPLFEVRTSRQRYAVHAPDEEQQLGEIALDETVISRPNGQPQTSLQRVEVEAKTDAHEPLQTLVDALRNNCSLEAAADNKYSQGLKSVGLAPAPVPDFQPTAVDSTMRVEEVALANLRRFLSAWHQHEPAARFGDDPEALHDLRVAGRRMDAILRQFEAFLPSALVRVRPTIKKVMRALGHARDLDVALLELQEFNDTLNEDDRAKLLPLQEHLNADRVVARQKMLATLDSSGVQKDFDKLRATLAHPASLLEAQPVSPLVTLSELIRSRYKKVRKAADRLTAESSMDEYHAVRGRVKKLRYALETAAVLFGKPADEMVKALRRWQEKLGAQQDADVAGRRLRALAMQPPTGLPSETLFLMGQLAAHYHDRAWKARKRHPRAYRKVQERWKALKSKLHQPPQAPLGPVDSETRDRL